MTIHVSKGEKFEGLDKLSLEQSKQLIKYSVAADQPVNIVGPPGIGKSAIVAMVAKELNMPFEPMILSLCDPTDIGGFPVTSLDDDRRRGQVDRLPLGVIKRACDKPVLLFLDELSTASPAVQGAAMRLIYERWAGDDRLHPGTRIVAAMNPPDQAAGGWEIALPLLGRMTQIRMQPTLEEVQDYFFKCGEPESKLRELATDLAATLHVAPELLQFEPPNGASASGTPWGAPRSWERALRVCAKILEGSEENSDRSPAFAATVAGNVGEDVALSWMVLRKVRDELPSVADIVKDPFKAKLPHNTNTGIAVIGVLAQVAMKAPNQAYIYADRQKDEIRLASSKVVMGQSPNKEIGASFFKDANTARMNLIKSISNTIKSVHGYKLHDRTKLEGEQ